MLFWVLSMNITAVLSAFRFLPSANPQRTALWLLFTKGSILSDLDRCWGMVSAWDTSIGGTVSCVSAFRADTPGIK